MARLSVTARPAGKIPQFNWKSWDLWKFVDILSGHQWDFQVEKPNFHDISDGKAGIFNWKTLYKSTSTFHGLYRCFDTSIQGGAPFTLLPSC